MSGNAFERIVTAAFVPFLRELGFTQSAVHSSGRFSSVKFQGSRHVLCVSYEYGDDYLNIMLLTRGTEELRDMDDPTKSPRLADLNNRYASLITPEERADNQHYFADIVARDPLEHRLLKSAKELRLALIKHLELS
ncbi:MAG: hypothetical protein ACAH88_05990 [Roseimicrobium sp.]